jgi:PKD repeat protein
MNDKKILMALVSLLLVAMLGLPLTVSVEEEEPERIIGVEKGYWVKYGNFLATYESDDPSAQTPPSDLIEHNNTEWVVNTVEAVSETSITFQTKTHYKNDTETTSILYVDIYTGAGNGSAMFVSANLSQGECIYGSEEYDNTWINQTMKLVYADSIRNTNYMESTTTLYVGVEGDQELVYRIEYFWDKITGVLSERTGTFLTTTEEYQTFAMKSEVLLDTNIWKEVPDTKPPTARAGSDQTASVNQTVSFDGGDSSDDEDGWGIASYQWDFGDGVRDSGVTTTHVFRAPGNYTVTLTVEDYGGNSDQDTLIVTVQEAFPLPSMGVVVLVIILLTAGLLVWRLRAKK